MAEIRVECYSKIYLEEMLDTAILFARVGFRNAI